MSLSENSLKLFSLLWISLINILNHATWCLSCVFSTLSTELEQKPLDQYKYPSDLKDLIECLKEGDDGTNDKIAHLL